MLRTLNISEMVYLFYELLLTIEFFVVYPWECYELQKRLLRILLLSLISATKLLPILFIFRLFSGMHLDRIIGKSTIHKCIVVEHYSLCNINIDKQFILNKLIGGTWFIKLSI